MSRSDPDRPDDIVEAGRGDPGPHWQVRQPIEPASVCFQPDLAPCGISLRRHSVGGGRDSDCRVVGMAAIKAAWPPAATETRCVGQNQSCKNLCRS